MAKAAIKKLKERRWWRWLMVEVQSKPAWIEYYRTHPIKRRKYSCRLSRKQRRDFDNRCEQLFRERVLPMLEARRKDAERLVAGRK